MTPTRMEILSRARDRLMATPHGDRQAVIEQTAAALGCSVQTVYRQLAAIGYDTGRKRRTDAGETQLTLDELRLISGALLVTTNNKRQRMPLRPLLEMLHASGQLRTLAHEGTVSRLLYRHRLHPAQLGTPEPAQRMRSLHPNHLWQVDATVGAYYYMPGGRLRWMSEAVHYKNKPENLVKVSADLVTRMGAVDTTSGAFKLRHYLGGETAENLVDFLTWAMWKQPESPMHGVPLMLLMDPGAANTGKLVRNLCRRLGIQLMHHAPGAARVTGSVEKTHDIVRAHFESRLRFLDPRTVTLELLNELGSRWAAHYCGTSRHTRHGMTRYAKWLEIKPEQLRTAASLEALRDAAVNEPETRRVANDRTISFGGRAYDLSAVPGVVPGLKVTIAANPFRAPAVDVLYIEPSTGAETWHVIEPLQLDGNGFPIDAPVWGEDHRTAAFTEVDHSRNRLAREAYRVGDALPTLEEAKRARKQHAQAYRDRIQAMADVDATPAPTYIPKRATALELPRREMAPELLSHEAAAIRLKAMMGGAYTPQVFQDLRARWPQHQVPAAELEAIALGYRAGDDDQAASAVQGA